MYPNRQKITFTTTDRYQPADDSKEIISTPELFIVHSNFKRKILGRRTPTTIDVPKKNHFKRKLSYYYHSSGESEEDDNFAYQELKRKQSHPLRLHEEIWHNDKGELNDGPVCRCSVQARTTGIRHGIYPGENPLPACDPYSNNSDKLYHYSFEISPKTNFTSKYPTTIEFERELFKFEGFSLLSHVPLPELPPCKMLRFNIEYTVTLVPEVVPTNFTIEGLELLKEYLYKELLELYDLDWDANGDETGCPRFHIYPRFVNQNPSDVKKMLSIDVILEYLTNELRPLKDDKRFYGLRNMSHNERDQIKGDYKDMIMWAPGKKPAAVRCDQIDYEIIENGPDGPEDFPGIVHHCSRPPQLSYSGNPQYQRARKDLLKFKHLLANKPKVCIKDRQLLAEKEEKLQELKEKESRRNEPAVLPLEQFFATGLWCDLVQHAMLVPVVVCHLRFHQALECLEKLIDYTFDKKYLLQLAMTHPSYRENYGTNPDHVRNVLANCGIRQPEYGNNRVHFQNTRKRGIDPLYTIMSKSGCKEETASNVNHNERLEFLGDAVVEFLTSIHLYFLFPDLEEGSLATFRAALVQNQYLAELAQKLKLDQFMLYAHGSDLCHESELRHAMANCFEALIAALFLDSGLNVADKVLSNVLFGFDTELYRKWVNYPSHPLQLQHPEGDRHLIAGVPRLEKLAEFEQLTGIQFKHIRLLARAFTHQSIGFNILTLGTNQRMEYLGDTVMQLIVSEYLYKHFPNHHEGHLSLLRSSLVNNRTQAIVCSALGMVNYAFVNIKGELRTKDRADLLEAFIGALFVDRGLDYCRTFCSVCFFPLLQESIVRQDWNDPKSRLQQCCLTLRSPESREPDMPSYRILKKSGPTNSRVFEVGVYFRDRRLATGSGPSVQEAEMLAATNALDASRDLFPQLEYQRKRIKLI